MKAIILEETGSVEQLKYVDLEPPVPGENEVLIDVKAIGINPVDYKVRQMDAVLTMICGAGYPLTLGWDIAGRVLSVGDGVTRFKAGDDVFGMINFPGRGNAYADQVVAPEDHLAKMPGNASYDESAATTLAALTAWQSLNERVRGGDRVLIHAGSGGVGHFAIQIAKHLGAYVISTSSARNRDFVLSMGADEHIDYRTQAFEEVVSDVDFVLDGLGDDILLKSIQVTKRGGIVISLPTSQFSDAAVSEAQRRNVDASFVLVTSNGDDMRTLKSFVEQGVIRPHVSHTFTFDEMRQAHIQLESGRTVGKVVVRV